MRGQCVLSTKMGNTYRRTSSEVAAEKTRRELAVKQSEAKWKKIMDITEGSGYPLKIKEIDILLESLMARGWSNAAKFIGKKLLIEPIIKKYFYGSSKYKDYDTAVRKHIQKLSLKEKCQMVVLIAQVKKDEFNLLTPKVELKKKATKLK